MEYTIIQSNVVSELEKVVKDHLDDGWRPQGGVCAVIEEDRSGKKLWRYLQAMGR